MAKLLARSGRFPHDIEHKFDAEDERIMRSLGQFASSAYQVLAYIDAAKSKALEYQ